MQGREHFFWSLSAYSVSIFAFTVVTGARDLNWKWYLILFMLLFVSMVLNELGNWIKSHNKKLNKNRGKGVDKIPITRLQRNEKMLLHLWAYFILLVTMIYTGIVSMPASGGSSLFLLIGYMTAVFGGEFPDKDFYLFRAGGHRNPVTHSGMIFMSIGVIAILVCPIEFLPLMFPVSSLLLGSATHLICDQFKSNQMLSDAFAGIVKFKSSPGDIRGIKSDKERQWLAYHSVWLLSFSVIALLRIGRYWFMDYMPIWNGTNILMSPVPWMMVASLLVYYVVSMIMIATWRKK